MAAGRQGGRERWEVTSEASGLVLDPLVLPSQEGLLKDQFASLAWSSSAPWQCWAQDCAPFLGNPGLSPLFPLSLPGLELMFCEDLQIGVAFMHDGGGGGEGGADNP